MAHAASSVPAREGVLIFDGTSFPKQGDRSVGVARQYCGALGKIANCQVATTAALWTGTHAWLLGAQLYLPQGVADARGADARRIPATVRFQEKWRHALTLFRQIRAAGFRITAVLADAEFGDNSRCARRGTAPGFPTRWGFPRRSASSSGRPRSPDRPPSRSRRHDPDHADLPAGHTPCSVATLVASWPAAAWRSITWRNAPAARSWTARFAAQRVTPAHAWRRRHRAPEVWLLAERDRGTTPRTRYYLIASARDHVAARAGAAGASALGDRTAVSRTQGRARARSLRRPLAAGVAAPCRPHRRRLHLLTSRTTTPPARDLTLPRVRPFCKKS